MEIDCIDDQIKNQVQTNMYIPYKAWTSDHAGGSEQLSDNIEIECESKCYTMHSSGKNSLAAGLLPYIFP